MMKIKYNISKHKRIDLVQFFLYCFVVLVLSVLFLFIGIKNLSSKEKKLREAKEQQELYRTKLNYISKNTREYHREINAINKKWRNKVRFSNSLIAAKTYDIIGKLNVLEELLPAGVYIQGISFKVDAKSDIDITVVADSYPNLFHVYKNFSKYDPSIVSESESDGIFTAHIRINLELKKKNEKK